MATLTHTDKLKIARQLRTHAELINRTPLFETAGWEARKRRMARKQAMQGKPHNAR